ncbi:potassium channel family protein [Sulfurovum sp.]|uniref:potassium channel family protein n=1 Tax=Sulfurovum sp. TaxID=1969726 RepID=UPI002867F4B3|nr:potassium channel family protein [Sulfurovum sp.]
MTTQLIQLIVASVHASIKIVDKIFSRKKNIVRLLVIILPILIFSISRLSYSEYFFPTVLLFGYPIFLHFLYKEIETIKEEKLAIIIMLFLIVSLNIILSYGIIAYGYNLLETNPATKIGLFDSFYWASTTFTTLGYGDYLPVGNAGKFLSIAISLTGIMHMVSFLAIFLNKLNRA